MPCHRTGYESYDRHYMLQPEAVDEKERTCETVSVRETLVVEHTERYRGKTNKMHFLVVVIPYCCA